MTKQVDAYRFVSGITKRALQTWAGMEPKREIPWTPLSKPLAACKAAVISSGGIALKDDLPFDQEGERQNPWWGDPSFRIIPRSSTSKDIRVYHQHIDPSFAEADLNCLLPIQRLIDLETAGVIGEAAESHYSFMGYILEPAELLEKTVPAIIGHLEQEGVDVVLLVPA